MATFIGSADILLDPTQQLDQAEVVRSSGPGIKPQNQNIGDFAALYVRFCCASFVRDIVLCELGIVISTCLQSLSRGIVRFERAIQFVQS
jgi:hypothetical protein